MSDIDGAKYRAALAAAALVESGMTVGLGSGTTSSLVIQCLGERIRREGLSIVGTASSEASSELARSVGIRLVDLDDLPSLDIDLDGADEVDPQFRMIKGRGGALLREKIVASAARRRVIVVIADKLVAATGHEGSRARRGQHVRADPHRAPPPRPRRHHRRPPPARMGLRFATDGGNAIVDCSFPPIEDAGSAGSSDCVRSSASSKRGSSSTSATSSWSGTPIGSNGSRSPRRAGCASGVP